jgi:hypothetical protein
MQASRGTGDSPVREQYLQVLRRIHACAGTRRIAVIGGPHGKARASVMELRAV